MIYIIVVTLQYFLAVYRYIYFLNHQSMPDILTERFIFLFKFGVLHMSDSMSKQGEKMSTSKNYIFMKKYERI